MKFCLTLAATVLLGAISLEAHAQQPWLADRAYGEGIGIRVGNLELHPGIAGEVGYDSNYFLRAPGEQGGVLSAYVLRVTPSITMATLGAQRGLVNSWNREVRSELEDQSLLMSGQQIGRQPDRGRDYTESLQMFSAIKYFGGQAKICIFEDESHMLEVKGKPLSGGCDPN